MTTGLRNRAADELLRQADTETDPASKELLLIAALHAEPQPDEDALDEFEADMPIGVDSAA